MEKLVVRGGQRLEGEVEVHSAKNSVLALLAASVLCPASVTIHRCPKIFDVMNMLKILQALGCEISWSGDSLTVDASSVTGCELPGELTRAIRSSIFLLGPVIARLKKGLLAHPGGCDIGLRPIDLHIKGLEQLGVKITDRAGLIRCDGENVSGGTIHLDYPSVGATENLMMAAVLAEGRETLIYNAAREPEIVDLEAFINAMGGKVRGAGTECIRVEGVAALHGAEYTPIPDRIVAGTYLLAGAITGGEIVVRNCVPEHISSLISKLGESACNLRCLRDKIYLKAPARPRAVHLIETSPYPGFPTDLQAQFLAYTTVAEGTSVIRENLFETRFKHVGELARMGADVTVRDRIAVVRGVQLLRGAEVTAQDLRGGAALVLAGLAAEGTTVIREVHHIERGYLDLAESLKKLGARIEGEEESAS